MRISDWSSDVCASDRSATAKSGPVPTNQGHRSVLIPGPPASVRIRTTAYRRRSPVWEGWGREANAGSMTGVPDRTTRPLGRAGHLAGDGSVEELQPCQLRVQAALRDQLVVGDLGEDAAGIQDHVPV